MEIHIKFLSLVPYGKKKTKPHLQPLKFLLYLPLVTQPPIKHSSTLFPLLLTFKRSCLTNPGLSQKEKLDRLELMKMKMVYLEEKLNSSGKKL